jgi:hypothetical protein
MLPILTLDGGNLLNLLLNKVFNYLTSFYISIFISFLTIIFLIYFCISYFHNFNLFLMSIFLIFKIIKIIKNIKYSYNKFLLERYLYNFRFKKRKYVNNIGNMYRDCYHIFGNRTEKEVLNDKFKVNL